MKYFEKNTFIVFNICYLSPDTGYNASDHTISSKAIKITPLGYLNVLKK